MSTSCSRSIRLYACLLFAMGFTNLAIATEQTYVREYTYQASEADSKISARAIALQEVKRELLAELGTHVTALVKIQASSDGHQLGKEEIETLSAGVTKVEILDEKWNGVVYVLKAQIKADPEDVLKSLNKMLDADKKQKQISQLSNDLSKTQAEKIQVAESLTQSKKEATTALEEIARLKKLLEEKQTDTSRQTIQAAYQQQVDQLSANELFNSAVQYYGKGNFSEAARLFQKAAEQGDVRAQFNLGLMYNGGDGVARDAKQAVYWFQKAAEQGYADAQYYLGLKYFYEQGERDTKQALYWYQKAAEQGHAEAQISLGLAYGANGLEMYPGRGAVWIDAKKAEYWLNKAAEQGEVSAQVILGEMYSSGKGVNRDAEKTVYWFQKAAEQGDAQAQFNLGVSYDIGSGVARDLNQAVYWYQKAAEQGLAKAQVRLGVRTSDAKQAVYWWQKAAEQGDTEAQYNLGERYAKGDGVSQDYVRAYMWFNLSGDSSALVSFNEKRMTIKQIVQAKRMAQDCRQRNFKNCG